MRIRVAARPASAVLALLVVWSAPARARAPGQQASSPPPVSLVASYQYTNGRSGHPEVWFVDSQGRQFTLSPALVDLLTECTAGGRLSLPDVARLIRFARPAPRIVPAGDIEHAVALVERAERSTLRTHQTRKYCRDGSTILISGYFLPPAKATQEVIVLQHSYCNRAVDENLSPEAQELTGWISRLWRQFRSPGNR